MVHELDYEIGKMVGAKNERAEILKKMDEMVDGIPDDVSGTLREIAVAGVFYKIEHWLKERGQG